MRYNNNKANQDMQNEFLLFPQIEQNYIKCFKQVIPLNVYHFYISDEISGPEPYMELLHTLKTAEQHDRIIIYLNSPGGLLFVAIQIVNAIQNSQAKVITCLDGQVCSAATLIFLAGHEYVINKHGSFMIHNYSEWLGGKGNEVVSRALHSFDMFKKVAADLYGAFLTKDEIEAMMQGRDIWLDSDQVIERVEAAAKRREEEAEQEEKQVLIEINTDEIDQLIPVPAKAVKRKKKTD